MSTSPGARRRRRCFDPDSKSYPDLDPGLAPYLVRTEQITEKQFYEMVNHESGLLGISEISSDMRDLLAQETADVRAAEAVALCASFFAGFVSGGRCGSHNPR